MTVLRAFGVDAPPRLLAGGQGTSWVAGGLVFKPAGGPAYEWLAEALADLVPDEIRLAMPVPTRHGTWVCEGWAATHWVEGSEPDRAAASTWIEIVELMEIQNNGDYAASYLVDSLNAAYGKVEYAYVPKPAATGTDAVRVAMIYKPAKLVLVGGALSDANAIYERPPMAQAFKAANGAKFSLVVNHLRAKRCITQPAATSTRATARAATTSCAWSRRSSWLTASCRKWWRRPATTTYC